MSPTVPHFYDPNNMFSSDHHLLQFDPSVGNGAGYDDQLPVSPESNGETVVSSAWMYSLAEELWNVSSDLDAVAFSNSGTDLYDIASDQSFGDDGFQADHHTSDHFNGVYFKPAAVPPYSSPSTGENYHYGVQCKYELRRVEESEKKVNKYSEEERKEKIFRYLKKRSQRNFNKTIKYACRKTLADRRVRVRGRFAKNNASYDAAAEILAMENNHNPRQNLYFADQTKKLEDDGDEWLRPAMANPVYLCQPFPQDI